VAKTQAEPTIRVDRLRHRGAPPNQAEDVVVALERVLSLIRALAEWIGDGYHAFVHAVQRRLSPGLALDLGDEHEGDCRGSGADRKRDGEAPPSAEPKPKRACCQPHHRRTAVREQHQTCKREADDEPDDLVFLLEAEEKQQRAHRHEIARQIVFEVDQGETADRYAFGVAEALRDAGVSVVLDANGGSFKAQMRRADASGARFAVILGEEETRARQLSLKPLRMEGEQVKASIAEIIAIIKG